MIDRIYLIDLLDSEKGPQRITKTIEEILEEVNRERSAEWADYTITDAVLWGLEEILDWIYWKIDREYYDR